MAILRWQTWWLFFPQAAIFFILIWVPAFRPIFLRSTSYYLTLVAVLFWCVSAYRAAHHLNFSFKVFLKDHYWSLLLIFVLVCGYFWVSPPEFKVLSDETNFVGVSWSFAFRKIFAVPEIGRYFFNHLNPEVYSFDRRPPLFPFLIHVIHTLTGYHYWNSFLLNFLLFFVLAATVYLLFGRKYGRIWGISGVFLAFSIPCLLQSETSGGTEPLFLALFALSIALLVAFLSKPSTPLFNVLWLTALLIGLSRSEGVLIPPFLFILLLAFQKLRGADLSRNLFFGLSPLLISPSLVQLFVVNRTSEQWTDHVFHPRFIIPNLEAWRSVLSDGGWFYPYPTALIALSLPAVAFLIFQLVSKQSKLTAEDRITFIYVAMIGAGIFFINTMYFWSKPNRPECARMYILPLSILILSIPVAAAYFRKIFLRPQILLLFTILTFIYYEPLGQENLFPKSMEWYRAHKMIVSFLNQQQTSHEILLITETPNQYLIYNLGAIYFQTANAEKSRILNEMNRHLYRQIYVVQEIRYDTGNPTQATSLDHDFVLQTLSEKQYTDHSFLRFSRLDWKGAP